MGANDRTYGLSLLQHAPILVTHIPYRRANKHSGAFAVFALGRSAPAGTWLWAGVADAVQVQVRLSMKFAAHVRSPMARSQT